jgi:hypothetical protein
MSTWHAVAVIGGLRSTPPTSQKLFPWWLSAPRGGNDLIWAYTIDLVIQAKEMKHDQLEACFN